MTDLAVRPCYDDLPLLGKSDVRHAWDVLDVDGSLRWLTPERVVAATRLVRSGTVIPLNLAVDAFSPPLFGRAEVRHRIVDVDRNNREDVLDAFNPQSSSQWDGLGHVRAREFGWFGGRTDLVDAAAALGIEQWARRGIAGRGVLLDVARVAEAAGRPIDPFSPRVIDVAELTHVADEQGIEPRPGDLLLIRTGWAAAFLSAQAAGRRPELTAWCGLHAGEQTARFVWDHQLAAVGADNPAIESAPGDPAAGSLHRRLIPGLGVALAELLDLERLAAECAAQQRWEFLFIAVPLPVQGAVSSPSNAMAVL